MPCKYLSWKIKKMKKDRFNYLTNFSGDSKFDKYLYATYLTYIQERYYL